jgi:hypothetical protein
MKFMYTSCVTKTVVFCISCVHFKRFLITNIIHNRIKSYKLCYYEYYDSTVKQFKIMKIMVIRGF